MSFLENKIPPPLIGIIIALAMWWLSKVTPVVALSPVIKYSLVSGFICIGLFFDLAGIISFRLAKTTVNPLKPQKASALVTSGIYQFTRNPMYVGLAALLCAWAIYLGSLWAMLLVGVYVLYIQRFQIIPEEKVLFALFKEDFTQYKSQVRRWL